MSYATGQRQKLGLTSGSLVPIVHNLEQDGIAQFHFVQGTHRVPAPRGYEEYFGPPPHYSFYTNCSLEDLERRGLSQDSEQIGDTPEETLRNLSSSDTAKPNKEGYIEDLDRFNKLLDSEGPFDAVLGFSLGACVAATLLEDNIRRSRDKGVPSMFKMAIFLCGCPPFDLRNSGLLLADTAGKVFQLPTVHVIGSADPLIDFALALYNLCDPDTAEIFDHGRGHQLIW